MTMRECQRGVSLIELIVFIVVVSIALVAFIKVFNQSVINSVDPIVQITGLELAQSKLDEVLARKFDENTPTGGVPACGSAEPGASACAGISADAGYDDVGDFNGQVDTAVAGYSVATTVVNAGADLGLAADQARRITVVVSLPNGETVQLATYKVNF
ncbi:type IV pilus modification PilV family protein [Simiduia aestuariiviva]|uniref:MSHA pilin protein MshD n=1 Tax=Simiduia aestuariiviva TaxID=1510459 RepID=A0A839US69_9GAMM|nr:prepilin-type N-terminal cleavage/methylation domain-containing protein [Simiduia aestuariiviva]MBB3168756.1 MSHA pilin protein MshD [Simiduia aestuariiviva]